MGVLFDYDTWKTTPPEYDDPTGTNAFKCDCCGEYICVGEEYYETANGDRLCECCIIKRDCEVEDIEEEPEEPSMTPEDYWDIFGED